MTIQEFTFYIWMSLKELLGSNSFEDLDYVGGSELWMSCHEEMHMVWHDFLSDQDNAFLFCYHFMELMKIISNVAY
jgi:hypothetical protein